MARRWSGDRHVIRSIRGREPTDHEYRALAELRYQIRRFVDYSAQRARAAGLRPQQHQALLALRGRPPGTSPTIGFLAERLQLRHHSAVGLVDRLARRGLVVRRHAQGDRRQVLVHLTRRGQAALRPLARHHVDELSTIGPALSRALEQLFERRRRRSA